MTIIEERKPTEVAAPLREPSVEEKIRPPEREVPSEPARLVRWLPMMAGILAVVLAGAIAAQLIRGDEASDTGVTPLIEADLAVELPTAVVQPPGLADWARLNSVSGLSPASVSALIPAGVEFGNAAGLADWAHLNRVSGLSPASVSAVAGTPNLADWARANGVSDLSPASLAPVSD